MFNPLSHCILVVHRIALTSFALIRSAPIHTLVLSTSLRLKITGLENEKNARLRGHVDQTLTNIFYNPMDDTQRAF